MWRGRRPGVTGLAVLWGKKVAVIAQNVVSLSNNVHLRSPAGGCERQGEASLHIWTQHATGTGCSNAVHRARESAAGVAPLLSRSSITSSSAADASSNGLRSMSAGGARGILGPSVALHATVPSCRLRRVPGPSSFYRMPLAVALG